MNAFTVGYCLGTNFPVGTIVILFYHYTLVNLGEVIGGGGGGGAGELILCYILAETSVCLLLH